MRYSNVCLNAGDKLRRTVGSILAQSYPHYEIIVKDGMSTDGSVDKLPEDGRIRIVRQKDRGIYDAMNQATLLAEGDYLLYLNCGDYF
ncbi:glycosyltransferase, partial [uncultured Muribaculum sp.]|uniref:glycosyltransferase n=1 Tax=uncultured Muribaculum sp. TaxID=1918613 RepID=UPI00272A8135